MNNPDNNESTIITLNGVTKTFGKTTALDNVDLTVTRGHIVGLLGANGCGKSTLMRHIIGLYLPTTGSCTTFDCDAGKLGPQQLARIGYVHQEGQLMDWMTTRQHIDYVAAYYDNWNTDLQARYMERFDIDLKSRVGKLSPGQRQKLAILLAIGHKPELLILDEPASGLDTLARCEFFDLLLEFVQDPARTIIISSHILSDIEKVIDHTIIMDKGKILIDTPFDELRESYWRVRLTGLTQETQLPFNNILTSQYEPGQALLTLQTTDHTILKQTAESLNCQYEITPLSLEEIYKVVINNQNNHLQETA